VEDKSELFPIRFQPGLRIGNVVTISCLARLSSNQQRLRKIVPPESRKAWMGPIQSFYAAASLLRWKNANNSALTSFLRVVHSP
jgi:hypothetical protein